jgi:hypothetical protein
MILSFGKINMNKLPKPNRIEIRASKRSIQRIPRRQPCTCNTTHGVISISQSQKFVIYYSGWLTGSNRGPATETACIQIAGTHTSRHVASVVNGADRNHRHNTERSAGARVDQTIAALGCTVLLCQSFRRLL